MLQVKKKLWKPMEKNDIISESDDDWSKRVPFMHQPVILNKP